jgi:hypothetical protein
VQDGGRPTGQNRIGRSDRQRGMDPVQSAVRNGLQLADSGEPVDPRQAVDLPAGHAATEQLPTCLYAVHERPFSSHLDRRLAELEAADKAGA